VKRGKFVNIAGPSAAAGKGAIMGRLLEMPDLHLVRLSTYTTRAPRPNDPNESRVFVSKNEFLRLKKQRFFVETKRLAYAWYGSPRPDIEKNLKNGKNVVSDVDPQRIKVFRKHFPDMVAVFVEVPNDILRKRMTRRGDPKEQQAARLRVATRERHFKPYFDLVVTNDEGKLEEVVKTIADFLKSRLNIT
jgi:guanylate kinase